MKERPSKATIIQITLAVLLAGAVFAAMTASASPSAGNQIWSETENMPASYTWTPQMFPGFYYDPGTGLFTEEIHMRINAGDREIGAEEAEYVTRAENVSFACEKWGGYRFIAWFGEPYLAGYVRHGSGKPQTTYFSDDTVNFLEEGALPKILIDTGEQISLKKGETLTLRENYTATLVSIDENSGKPRILLKKNGKEADNAAVSGDYVYRKTIGGAEDVPVIAIRIGEVTNSRIEITGLFQISDDPETVEEGMRKKSLRVEEVSGDGIRMVNPSDISLPPGKTVTLSENMELRVRDNDENLCFELTADETRTRTLPLKDISRNETAFEKAGTVYDAAGTLRGWTGLNFPGFRYDDAAGNCPEELSFGTSITRDIEPGELTYTAKTMAVPFEHDDWGSFMSINIGAEAYFAGYAAFDDKNASTKKKTTSFADKNYDLIYGGTISKVLIDSAEKATYADGSKISLKEGYAVSVENIGQENNKTVVTMTVLKNGSAAAAETLEEGENLICRAKINGTTIPVLVLHVDTIYDNAAKSTVTIDGVFQVSEHGMPTEPGSGYGGLEVAYVSRNGLKLTNKEEISLKKGTTVPLAGNMAFYVSASDSLCFFPYILSEKTKKSADKEMRMEISQPRIQGRDITITVSENETGGALADVRIAVDGVTVGETNESGMLTLTPAGTGSMTVTASVSGYNGSEMKITVEDPEKFLMIVLPERIYDGDLTDIQVTNGAGTPVAEIVCCAEIAGDGETGLKTVEIGRSNDTGFISLAASPPGTFNLTASGDGYYNGTASLTILEKAPLMTITDISAENMTAGKKGTVRVTVENQGRLEGTLDVVVSYGGVDQTQKASLNANETTVLSYTVMPAEAGDQFLTVNGENVPMTVGGKISLFRKLTASLAGKEPAGETADAGTAKPAGGETNAVPVVSLLFGILSFAVIMAIFTVLTVLAIMIMVGRQSGRKY